MFYGESELRGRCRGDLGEHDTLLSIAKATRLLGYRPAYSWRETVTP
jgi:UDP-glucose 4-epimerase